MGVWQYNNNIGHAPGRASHWYGMSVVQATVSSGGKSLTQLNFYYWRLISLQQNITLMSRLPFPPVDGERKIGRTKRAEREGLVRLVYSYLCTTRIKYEGGRSREWPWC